MTYETIRVSVDCRGVAALTLARPDKHNALSGTMIGELTTVARLLGADTAVRAVVLAADGVSFCAGGDLGWMKAQIEADRAGRMAEARRLALMFKALNDLPKPVIARVQGNSFGGGVGLLCIADVAVAAETTKFGLTETRLGLIPATISPYVVARIGEGQARPLFMSGRILDAQAAQAAGLLTRVVSLDDLDAAVEAEISPYLQVAPGAVGQSKALARSLGMPITDEVIAATIVRLADVWETDEAREGISAFLEKRTPSWRVPD
ncbi:crotonase/enoyl-CoA hydratase family protein [Rhizobium sp. Root483D2]|uniref:crotonase/enoyl-CoA hydratase family protein n=1 Tax=Rhizobium sp. Root483D2 TaxID=1736545 RepID=UPI000714C001|nr:crotonase/enoyl-CoA hydratase family protein [Rhizobium sp. Root483D2]KQY45749.1 enoyl-CoA hydratase [Rhizobium sp. Root483D2]